MMDESRVRRIHKTEVDIESGKIIYWMERDHRVNDNWALLYAQALALVTKSQLEVTVLVNEETITWQERQLMFALDGLEEVEENLRKYQIPLKLFLQTEEMITYLAKEASGIVTDFNPLKRKSNLMDELVAMTDLPLIEVDAHNIVPCRLIHKGTPENAARTIRPKINKLLDVYLVEFPMMCKHYLNDVVDHFIEWDLILAKLSFGRKAKRLPMLAGEFAAHQRLMEFMTFRYSSYAELRNKPSSSWQSMLSPYFHFGHIAPARVALTIKTLMTDDDNMEDFLEEMIIRRELTDNYCFENPLCDSVDGLPQWARESLDQHLEDQRDYLYTFSEFESYDTHDPIWNAAQKELIHTGKIHGYLRMYWAKKILEWTPDYRKAFDIALRLNDTYALDGNDPNGIVGVAWSIGGIHDHGWKEREVFGKVRYMNANGCYRKFDVEAYINRVNQECEWNKYVTDEGIR